MQEFPEGTPPRRRSRLIAILVIAGLVVAGLVAWRLTHGSAASGGPGGRFGGRGGRPTATVGVAKAAAQDVPVTLSAIGTVQPVVSATVRTQLNGVLFSLHFTEGQMVHKGQLIAQIDPRPYRLALAQAEGTLARDQALLAQARVDLQRYQTLLKQDSIARQQVDTQAALVKQDEGTVETDRGAVGAAKLNLGYTSIVAPVSGKVGLRQADLGNYLTPGDANGIVVITQADPIDVSFALPQGQLPQVQTRLRQGAAMPVTALDQSGGATLATGRFLTFDNQIDTTSGTVKAKARFANPGGQLFPNQFVNVALLVDTLHNAVTVPVSAVRHGSQGDFVFLLTPQKTAKLQLVKLGPSAGGNIVLLSGVPAGQMVITEGADRLDDGSKVSLPGDRRGGRGGGQADGAQGGQGSGWSGHRHHRQGGGDGGQGGSGTGGGGQSGQ